jgi:hypothetical protein
MPKLKEIFKSLDKMIENGNKDYSDIIVADLNEDFFGNYDNQRLINSFLFNFSKIQDKIGSKLFKHVLFELKEINDYSVPMKDVVNILEKLEIIESADDWDRLREIRNILSHEYLDNIEERIQNIKLALTGYELMINLYTRLKEYVERVINQ